MIPLEKIQEGERVKYIPTHAKGDTNHSDCEDGVVKSKNDKYVFVLYWNKSTYNRGRLIEGYWDTQAKATDPNDLVYSTQRQ